MERQEYENVWEALEDDPAIVAALTAKSLLVLEIREAVDQWKISQAEAAKRLGITQPRLNDLLRGRLSKFSVDGLMKIAFDAGLKVNLQIEKAAA